MTADEIADEAQFFSFGTNDLTQMTFGFSRDDVGKFLRVYQDKKILEQGSVRQTSTPKASGSWCAMASQKGRAARPDLKLGICGEHGGDPASIHFFHKVGLDYVSARRIAFRWRAWRRRRRRWRQGRRLIRYFVHRGGRPSGRRLDPAWLSARQRRRGLGGRRGAHRGRRRRLCASVFGLHELAGRGRAASETQSRRSKATAASCTSSCTASISRPRSTLRTHEIDFFLAPNFLVTVHDGKRRSIAQVGESVRPRPTTSSPRGRSR